MGIQVLLPILQLILATANICVIGYGFYKFLNKPHDTLEAKHEELKKRVDEHDFKLKEVEQSLHNGNDRFKEQAETNEILIRSVFALLEFEVHYCETEQKPISKNLERAKDNLHDFLAKNS